MRAILEFCAGSEQRRFSAGDVLLRQGERTGRLYVLVEGQIEVVKGEAVVVRDRRAWRNLR